MKKSVSDLSFAVVYVCIACVCFAFNSAQAFSLQEIKEVRLGDHAPKRAVLSADTEQGAVVTYDYTRKVSTLFSIRSSGSVQSLQENAKSLFLTPVILKDDSILSLFTDLTLFKTNIVKFSANDKEGFQISVDGSVEGHPLQKPNGEIWVATTPHGAQSTVLYILDGQGKIIKKTEITTHRVLTDGLILSDGRVLYGTGKGLIFLSSSGDFIKASETLERLRWAPLMLNPQELIAASFNYGLRAYDLDGKVKTTVPLESIRPQSVAKLNNQAFAACDAEGNIFIYNDSLIQTGKLSRKYAVGCNLISLKENLVGAIFPNGYFLLINEQAQVVGSFLSPGKEIEGADAILDQSKILLFTSSRKEPDSNRVHFLRLAD